MSERERRELENALASTRMEGYTVTEQIRTDCIRLLSGEIDVSSLVNEVLSRPTEAV